MSYHARSKSFPNCSIAFVVRYMILFSSIRYQYIIIINILYSFAASFA